MIVEFPNKLEDETNATFQQTFDNLRNVST